MPLQTVTLIIVVTNLLAIAYGYGKLSQRVAGLEDQVRDLRLHVDALRDER